MSNMDDEIKEQMSHWVRVQSMLQEKQEKDKQEIQSKVADDHQPVLTFSRDLGCGSRIVADLIRQRTGYELLGWSLIDKVAEDIDCERRIIDRMDEAARSHIESLIDGMLRGRYVDREEYYASLIRVQRSFIAKGGVILLGRGANFAVEKGEGLRVRLFAPMETRIANLKQYGKVDEKAARRMIAQADARRAEFIKVYFKKDVNDPSIYDLLINLGTLSHETAATIILQALEVIKNPQAVKDILG